MKYLLDTNICIYIIKKKPRGIIKTFQKFDPFDIGISSITLSELEYGIQKSSFPGQNRLALHQFLAPIEIADYNAECGFHYGVIRNFLEELGQVIGPLDMLIASHCLALDCVLVTNNEKEFKRIPELRIENWS